MSILTLRAFIVEYIDNSMNQSIIRRDDNGDLVIRKLVKFKKPSTRFGATDNVNADVNPNGNIDVDDVETWRPDFDDC